MKGKGERKSSSCAAMSANWGVLLQLLLQIGFFSQLSIFVGQKIVR